MECPGMRGGRCPTANAPTGTELFTLQRRVPRPVTLVFCSKIWGEEERVSLEVSRPPSAPPTSVRSRPGFQQGPWCLRLGICPSLRPSVSQDPREAPGRPALPVRSIPTRAAHPTAHFWPEGKTRSCGSPWVALDGTETCLFKRLCQPGCLCHAYLPGGLGARRCPDPGVWAFPGSGLPAFKDSSLTPGVPLRPSSLIRRRGPVDFGATWVAGGGPSRHR